MSYSWQNVTQAAAFAPRDGAGALTHNGRMWLIGGWNPPDKIHFPLKCNNEVWSSANGEEWTLEKANTFLDGDFDPTLDWEGRHTAGYAVHQDKLWIVGGDPLQGHYQDDVWNSSDGRDWNCVTRQAPWGPRALHYTVAFRDKLWVMGGQTTPQFAPAPERLYNDVWSSTDGILWESVPTDGAHWSPRGMIGGSTVFKDRIWLLGGGTYDTPRHPRRILYSEVWSSADGSNWELHLEDAPWHGRQYHDVAVFDDKLWVMEGCYGPEGWFEPGAVGDANHNDVWYSSDGVSWFELADTPWAPRHAASVFVHDNALWMVTGNNFEADVWKLQSSCS
jgi:hypothetical protein